MSASRVSVLLLLAALVAATSAEIKLQSVERKISLNSQFARVTEQYKIKNTGSGAVDRVVLCQPLQSTGVIAYHKVTTGDESKAKLQLTSTKPSGAPSSVTCWEVALESKIASGQVASLSSVVVYAGIQTPYPAEIAQGEQQLMLYTDNLYVVSPYVVSAQTLEVVLPNSKSISYTDTIKPVSKSDNKIKYGKYDLIQPWTLETLRLHYENNKHFKKVTSLVREIEVSHWGNIYVEESYELKNDGAKHKGQFSRLKHSQAQMSRSNSFQELRARLPASAHSMYYVDLIGNISTSDVRKTASETILDIATRYPLMGGWKVDFKIGYSVPLTGFLYSLKGGKRRLSIDFSTPLEGAYVEDLTVRVVLPEGATGITGSLPYPVDQRQDVKYTYLDISGRPVLVLHKAHVVPEHAVKLHVEYRFGSTSILREPLMLITAFAALFLAAIVYNRLEFTIARDDKWQAAQDADKVATLMQAINNVMEEQDEVLECVLKLINSVRSSEEAEYASKERATLESEFTALENKAKGFIHLVAGVQPRVADKVRDVLDKLRALQGRFIKQLLDKCDLIRKGTAVSEVNKKLLPATQALKSSRQEIADAVETLFAVY